MTVTDQQAEKKYAITSYLKLLTSRVLRLEQEMSRHKKVSIILHSGDVEDESTDEAQQRAYVADVQPEEGQLEEHKQDLNLVAESGNYKETGPAKEDDHKDQKSDARFEKEKRPEDIEAPEVVSVPPPGDKSAGFDDAPVMEKPEDLGLVASLGK